MPVLVFFVTFFGMEALAWAMHKYVLHGPLWFLHKTHHRPSKSFWERNDLFILVYAVPSFIFTFRGIEYDLPYETAVGLGIAAYGLAYFIVHDILIHRRVKLWRKPKSRYLRALVRGHKVHHKHLHKEGSEVFGFLMVPRRFFR